MINPKRICSSSFTGVWSRTHMKLIRICVKILKAIMSCCKASNVILPTTLENTQRTQNCALSPGYNTPDNDTVRGYSLPTIDLVQDTKSSAVVVDFVNSPGCSERDLSLSPLSKCEHATSTSDIPLDLSISDDSFSTLCPGNVSLKTEWISFRQEIRDEIKETLAREVRDSLSLILQEKLTLQITELNDRCDRQDEEISSLRSQSSLYQLGSSLPSATSMPEDPSQDCSSIRDGIHNSDNCLTHGCQLSRGITFSSNSSEVREAGSLDNCDVTILRSKRRIPKPT